MLSIPDCGWTKITINNFEAPGSYLTDIPSDFLKACINVLEFGGFYTISIDSEGEEHLLVLNTSGVWIFSENLTYKTIGPEMSLQDFCLNTYKDISENLDAWANWELSDDVEEGKVYLSKLLLALKELLKI